MKQKRSYLVEREDEELAPGLMLSYRIQVDTTAYSEPGNDVDPPWYEEHIEGIEYEEVRLRIAVEDKDAEITLPLPDPTKKQRNQVQVILDLARELAEDHVYRGTEIPYWQG